MQVRSVLLALALFGAGCRSVSAPAAARAAAAPPPIPQFVARPAWNVSPRGEQGAELLDLWNLGDLDGDGFEDLAAEEDGFPQNWTWLVFGRDGAAKLDALNVTLPPHVRRDAEGSLDLARGFVNVGDTDGDGRPDIAMSECGVDTFGRFRPSGVWLFSTDPWRILKTWRRNVDSFGAFIAPVGDVDGDGKADMATVNDYNPPAVEVLSLASETSLWRVEFPFELGDVRDFIAIGDLDGAGCDELALSLWTGRRGSWMQCLLRGEDGTVIWSRSSPKGSRPGVVEFRRAGDVDGDGAPDLWTLGETPFAKPGRIELRSGRDGGLIRSFVSSCDGPFASTSAPDMDGDGANELAVLWNPDGLGNGGLVEVLSSRNFEALVQFHCDPAHSIAALRTPNGVRIVVTSGPSLQAFDLVSVEGAGER
jgi:hypothetical protein